MIKIYEMNETEWVAAETPEDAIKEIVDFTGEPAEDIVGEGCPRELTDKEMDETMFHDVDSCDECTRDTCLTENEDEDCTCSNERSFRKELDSRIASGEKFPCFFASVDF